MQALNAKPSDDPPLKEDIAKSEFVDIDKPDSKDEIKDDIKVSDEN